MHGRPVSFLESHSSSMPNFLRFAISDIGSFLAFGVSNAKNIINGINN